LFQCGGGPILLVYGEQAQATAHSWPAHVRSVTVAEANNRLHLAQLLEHLAVTEQVNTVWTECGASLAGELISQQFADELIVYLAPKLLGAQAQPLVALPALTELSQATQLHFTEVEQIGDDIRITASLDYANFANQP